MNEWMNYWINELMNAERILGRARYHSVMEAPHNTAYLRVGGTKKMFLWNMNTRALSCVRDRQVASTTTPGPSTFSCNEKL